LLLFRMKIQGEIYQAMIDQYDLHTALKEENRIHGSAESTGFIVFPNPVDNEAWIRFDEALEETAKADIFNIEGKLIMSRELFPGTRQYEITFDNCPEGFYFMRITSGNRFIGLHKLVIYR